MKRRFDLVFVIYHKMMRHSGNIQYVLIFFILGLQTIGDFVGLRQIEDMVLW